VESVLEPMEGDSAAFNHVGICVSDLERSRRFYEEVLEFRYWWELTVPDEGASQLLQLPAPLGVTAVYLAHERFVLELIHFAEAGIRPTPQRVMNNPGLTHLSIAVAEISSTLEKVVPNGGEILQDTNIGGQAVMIRDPDGQLIELTSFHFHAMRPPWPEDRSPA
jgi:catechol 2,3-dioxygenase-like lactoylglutathione lyase family enzyme